MKVYQIPLDLTHLRNKMVNDHLEGNPLLRLFYHYTPSIENFKEVIADRKKFPVDRNALTRELHLQHQEYYSAFPNLKLQVETLQAENTFTVTTGHQLCLATGPLYFIYKIITTINLAKQLKNNYPEYHFVPVYWMATEDHDFEEINHIHIFNKKVKWDVDEKGATGKLSTTTISTFLDEIKNLLGDTDEAKEIFSMLSDAYLKHETLAEATRSFVLQLFASEGLLVIDADKKSLKKLFTSVIREELTTQVAEKLVNETNELLLAKGYPNQINPRPINLFYLDNNLRERIILTLEGKYIVLNTDLVFSHDEILEILDRDPERFSPNVIYRPLYQEKILPNLAYVGGPGELSYWMELKSLFEHHGIFYPMLISRNNALVLPEKLISKLHSFGFTNEDLFSTVDDLVNRYVRSQDGKSLSLEKEKEELQQLFKLLQSKIEKTDPSLSGAVQAELQRCLNGIEVIEKKLFAAVKRKNETALQQIKNCLEKVNPEQQPQERYLNFLPFYLRNRSSFLKELLNALEPFSGNLLLFLETEENIMLNK